MNKEKKFVDHFYDKYQGRLAIGVGYGQDLKEIFPFVFVNKKGYATGIVALGILEDSERFVYIYHLEAFIPRLGDGSVILDEICRQADFFKINLSVAAIPMKNGNVHNMDSKCLIKWYNGYGFKGNTGLLRKPNDT